MVITVPVQCFVTYRIIRLAGSIFLRYNTKIGRLIIFTGGFCEEKLFRYYRRISTSFAPIDIHIFVYGEITVI